MPLKKQIVFTEDEWNDFRKNLCEQMFAQAQQSVLLVDRETDMAIVERLRDYCWGMMSQMIDAAIK